MNYIPCGDKLLVKPDPIEEKSKGGIIRPQTRFVDLVSGVVVAVTDGFYTPSGVLVESLFKPGDKIFYQKGQEVAVEQLPDHVLIMEAAVVMRETDREFSATSDDTVIEIKERDDFPLGGA